jgi:ferredoxin
MAKDGKAMLMDSTESKGMYSGLVDDDFRSAMMDAVKRCPVNIIRIEH